MANLPKISLPPQSHPLSNLDAHVCPRPNAVIFLINEGIKSRYATDPFFKDIKTPAKQPIPGEEPSNVFLLLRNHQMFSYKGTIKCFPVKEPSNVFLL